MNVEYLNPFVHASYSVIEMVLGERPNQGEIAAQSSTISSQQCNVFCGVTGHAEGQVIYGMSLVTADRIASAMLGQKIKTFNPLAASAIGELGNMISGNALQLLADNGWICDITPPTIVRGANTKISTLTIPAIVVTLVTSLGNVCVTIGLQSRK